MRKWIVFVIAIGFVANGCKSEPQTEADEEKEQQVTEDDDREDPDTGDDDTITDKMAEEHEGDEPTATEAAEMEPRQPVTSEEVDYAEIDGDTISGYYAEPEEGAGDLPGLIVIQEWWGLNDNIRSMTDRLAGEGYRALAVDLYEGDVTDDPDEAQSLMQEAMNNKDRLSANLEQAREYLGDEVGAQKVGVIGWCFGGGWSLQTALMMPDKIDATVIYYGQLVTDRDKLDKLNMPIIGFFGGEDTSIPPEQVAKFENALEELGKQIETHIYEGAGHAFANPSGERYDAEAAEDAWEKTVEFLDEHLK